MSRVDIATAIALLTSGAGCGSAFTTTEMASSDAMSTYAEPNAAPPADEADAGGDAPPEREEDLRVLMPAQTDVYLFVPNPSRSTVTRVDVYTMAVDTAPVGAEPAEVLTTPDYRTAVIFNEGDDTVTLMDASSLESQTVAIRPNMNRMVMSPDGAWVVLWHDLAAEEDDDIVDGLLSYNEVSFVEVATGTFHAMAVGQFPHGVEFTPDGQLAVVVSDDSLALVDLTADVLQPEMVQVAEDLLDPSPAEEVLLTPEGRFAFVRQFGAVDLTVVDLHTLQVDRIPAGDNPTDLDLLPDGSGCVVVARDSAELWLYDLDDPMAAAEVLPLPTELTIGSVSFDPTGRIALLYSNAVLEARYATWDLATNEVVTRSLEKPIDTLSITPSGDNALIFHTLDNDPDADPSSPFYGAHALTMIDLWDFRTTPVTMPDALLEYANSTEGTYAFFAMEDTPLLGVLDWSTLIADQVDLSSNPVHVGVVPDISPGDDDEPPAWVSQEHELGRLSFYDTDDGSLRTITGFELNSQIEQ